MMPRLVRHPWSWAALVVFLVAGYHVSRVLAATQTVTATLPALASTAVALRPLTITGDSLSIWDAIELDPFREDRAAATTRYRLPGTAADTDRVAEDEAPVLTLLGTIMHSDGSGLALYQNGNDPPRLIRPGESIGGLTLQRVEQARATFADARGRVTTLTVSKGGAP